jgi:hypothetical protein
MDRLNAHDLQQSHQTLPVRLQTILGQHHLKTAASVGRVLHVQLIEPTHQIQVLRALSSALVVQGASGDTQQLALGANAQRLR